MSELEFSVSLGLPQALEKEAWFKEAIEEGRLRRCSTSEGVARRFRTTMGEITAI